ncbi:MAG: hypothetical protein ACYTFY_03165 [Planctomycetota bacterium]|jgi:hypothetical protein
MNKKNTDNKVVYGPPPEEVLGKPIALWKRIIFGGALSVVVIGMLWMVLWILDRLTHMPQ